MTHPPIEPLTERFDIRAVAGLVRRHAVVLLGCAGIGIAAGLVYDGLQTPIYTATAKLEAIPASARVLSSLKLEEGGQGALRIVATTRERLLSRALAERVVADMQLGQEPAFLPRDKIAHDVQPSTSIGDLIARTDVRADKRATDLLRAGLEVGTVRNTGLLKVSYSHTDRHVAAKTANQIVRAYIDMERDRLTGAAQRTRGIITAQLTEAESTLKASEAELVRLIEAANLSIGADGVPIESEGLAALRLSHAQATAVRVAAERRLGQMNRDGAATLPAAFTNASLQNVRNKLAALRAEYRMKRARMKPDFPAMLALADRISDFEGDVQRELEVIAAATRAEARQARAAESSLASEVRAAEKRSTAARKAGVGYAALKRENDAHRARYATLAAKLSEITVSAGLIAPPVTVAELASAPRSPSNGGRLLHILAGLLAFGALGAGISAWREFTRDAFDMPADVTEATGISVLGTVPRVRFGRFAASEANPASRVREAYRYLRNKLRAGALNDDGQVMLVTGVGRRAGASTTARRLAKDFGAVDRKVLLIDANFAAPGQAAAFDLEHEAGLAEILQWQPGLDVAGCFAKPDGNLTVLPAGTPGAETSDQLASDRMERLLALLKKSFDIVIIDTASITSRADAAAIMSFADAALLVLRHDVTKRSEMDAALKHLQGSKASIVGALYTRYERRAFQRADGPELRDRLSALRDMVVPQAIPRENPVHAMMGAAEEAMNRRRAA